MAVLLTGACLPSQSPAQDIVYLAAADGRTVTVLGLKPLRIIRPVGTGGRDQRNIQAALPTPDDRRLLLIDGEGDRILGVDLIDGQPAWEVHVAEGPEAARLSADGRQLAVCAERAGTVVFVDIVERRTVGSMRIDGPPPDECLFSPDGRWLVIARKGDAGLSVIDLHDGRVRSRLALSGMPGGMAFAGETLWVTVPEGRRVECIDTRSWKRLAPLTVGLQPVAVTGSPDGLRVYVANRGSDTVTLIDGATRRILRTGRSVHAPNRLALTTDGQRLLVLGDSPAEALLLDAERLSPLGRARLPGRIGALALPL